MKFIIATIKDLDKIVPLFNAYRMFYKQPFDIQKAQEFISERLKNNESVIILAIDGSNKLLPAIGFTQLYHCFGSIAAKRILILNDLYVTPEFRKQNIGRQLMRTAKNYAIKSNIDKIILSTENSNYIGQKLYESEGYQKDIRFLHYTLNINNVN